MELFFLFTAMWLGILTSISPCPMATNIAAISFISHRIAHKNIVFLSGILYTLGRSITYIIIGFLIVETLVNIPVLSDFLQRYINKILGIVLIIVGMVLIDLLKINFPSLSVDEKTAEKVLTTGLTGSLFLGILFALAFCPVSAALFFGALIPMSIKAKSAFGLPLIYGIGTGLPVLLFALIVSIGIGYVSSIYSRVTQLEFYTKKVTGVILILVGIYYVLSHIFGIFWKKKFRNMKIQVAVAACQRCHETEKNVCGACSRLNLETDILHVYDMKEFAKLGVLFTPAEIVDSKIDCFSSAAS